MDAVQKRTMARISLPQSLSIGGRKGRGENGGGEDPCVAEEVKRRLSLGGGLDSGGEIESFGLLPGPGLRNKQSKRAK